MTDPPAGVSRSAFSTRFDAICRIRSASPVTHASPATARKLDAEIACGRLVTTRRLARDLGEIDRLRPDRELGAVHSREIEQVAHEPLEPAALRRDHARRLARLERAFAETFRVAADRRQRRLQLVADREQERALGIT